MTPSPFSLTSQNFTFEAIPGRTMPAKFQDAVKLLRRPYIAISQAEYERLLDESKKFNTDVFLMNGREVTFGNADQGLAIMPLKERELNAAHHLVQDSNGYRDVDVYVREPGGSEWLFRVAKEASTGHITQSEARFSPSPDAEFGDEGEHKPPQDVLDAVKKIEPQVIARLEGYYPYRVTFKHAPGQADAFFDCWAKDSEHAKKMLKEKSPGSMVRSTSEFEDNDKPSEMFAPAILTSTLMEQLKEATKTLQEDGYAPGHSLSGDEAKFLNLAKSIAPQLIQAAEELEAMLQRLKSPAAQSISRPSSYPSPSL